jgi:hypothetical protein
MNKFQESIKSVTTLTNHSLSSSHFLFSLSKLNNSSPRDFLVKNFINMIKFQESFERVKTFNMFNPNLPTIREDTYLNLVPHAQMFKITYNKFVPTLLTIPEDAYLFNMLDYAQENILVSKPVIEYVPKPKTEPSLFVSDFEFFLPPPPVLKPALVPLPLSAFSGGVKLPKFVQPSVPKPPRDVEILSSQRVGSLNFQYLKEPTPYTMPFNTSVKTYETRRAGMIELQRNSVVHYKPFGKRVVYKDGKPHLASKAVNTKVQPPPTPLQISRGKALQRAYLEKEAARIKSAHEATLRSRETQQKLRDSALVDLLGEDAVTNKFWAEVSSDVESDDDEAWDAVPHAQMFQMNGLDDIEVLPPVPKTVPYIADVMDEEDLFPEIPEEEPFPFVSTPDPQAEAQTDLSDFSVQTEVTDDSFSTTPIFEAGAKVKETIDNVHSLTGKAREAFDSVKDAFGNVLPNGMLKVMLSNLSLLVHDLFCDGITPIVKFTKILNFIYTMYNVRLSTVSRCAAAQGGFDAMNLLNWASYLPRTFVTAGKYASAYNSIIKALTSSEDFALWMANHMPKCFQGIMDCLFPLYSSQVKDFRTLETNFVKMYCLMNTSQKIPKDLFDATKVAFDKFCVDHSFHGIKTLNLNMLKAKWVTLSEYHNSYDKYQKQRQQPFSIFLAGDPNVGKSVFAEHLIRAFAKLSKHEGDPIYTWNSQLPHWDGYRPKTFGVKSDDFAQMRDCALELATFFSFASRTMCILPMASIDNTSVGVKGQDYDARLFVACSNMTDFQNLSTHVLVPAAIRRRFHIYGIMKFKPGITSHSPDFSHFVVNVKKAEYNAGFTNYTDTDIGTYDYNKFMLLAAKGFIAHEASELALTKVIEPTLSPDLAKCFSYAQYGLAEDILLNTIVGNWYSFIGKKCYNLYGFVPSTIKYGMLAVSFLGIVYQYINNRRTDKLCETNYVRDFIERLNFVFNGVRPLHYKNVAVDVEIAYLEFGSRDAYVKHGIEKLTVWRKHGIEVDAIANFLKQNEATVISHLRTAESRIEKDYSKRILRTAQDADVVIPQTIQEKIAAQRNDVQIIQDTLHSSVNTPFFKQPKIELQPQVEGSFLSRDAQGFSDPNSFQISQSLEIGCIVLIKRDFTRTIVPVTAPQGILNIFHIRRGLWLLPKHFFLSEIEGEYIKNTPDFNYVMHIKLGNTTHAIDYDEQRVINLVDKNGQPTIDAVLLDLNHTTVPMGRDNFAKFISEKHIHLFQNGDVASIVSNTPVGNKLERNVFSVPLRIIENAVYWYTNTRVLRCAVGFCYNAPTRSGDCGAPIIVHNAAIPGKILGIHLYGGVAVESGGSLITCEMLERVIKVPEVCIPDLPVVFTPNPVEATNKSVQVLGYVQKGVFVPRDTAFVESEYCGLFPTKYPSPKSDPEIDPLLLGVAQFGAAPVSVIIPYENEIKEHLLNHLPTEKAKIFDCEEAIGAQGGMQPIDLTTSPGYPYVLNGKSKRAFIDNTDGVYTYRDPVFKKFVQEYCDSWRTTIFPVVWLMSLKDELIKPGKSARVFEYAPIEYVIACRVYFGSWISSMHSNPNKFMSSVGIFPESKQWTEMFRTLFNVSDVGFDSDVSKWDKHLRACVMFLALIVINEWYKINDSTWQIGDDYARHNIFCAMIHGYCLAGNLLFRKFFGMFSGFVLTALLNTLSNMIQHFVWFLLKVPLQYRCLSHYSQLVVTFIYGDDDLNAVSRSVVDFLNRESMAQVFHTYFGMIVTSSAKSGEMTQFDSLYSLQYLKRGTRKDGIVYKPLLDELSLTSMISFIRKSKYCRQSEQLFINEDVFLRFAYFYGPTYFNHWRSFFLSKHPGSDYPTYRYLDDLFCYGKYDDFLQFL